jgi:hypothetical protein
MACDAGSSQIRHVSGQIPSARVVICSSICSDALQSDFGAWTPDAGFGVSTPSCLSSVGSNDWTRSFVPITWPEQSISFGFAISAHRVCPTPVAELRAGPTRRPHCGTLAAATDECLGGSEVQPA